MERHTAHAGGVPGRRVVAGRGFAQVYHPLVARGELVRNVLGGLAQDA